MSARSWVIAGVVALLLVPGIGTGFAVCMTEGGSAASCATSQGCGVCGGHGCCPAGDREQGSRRCAKAPASPTAAAVESTATVLAPVASSRVTTTVETTALGCGATSVPPERRSRAEGADLFLVDCAFLI